MGMSTPISKELRPPENPVDTRAKRLWILQSVVWWGAILVIASVAFAFWTPARPFLLVVMIVAGVALLVGVLVEPFWRFRVHRWEITDEAVYGLSGWIVLTWRVAPISRIQTVDAIRGPIEQMLGLSTLRVTTASSAGSIDIVGLDKDVAAEAADRLTTIVELTPGDAT